MAQGSPQGQTDQTPAPGAAAVDIGLLLNNGPFTPLQKALVALTALSVLFDGFDTVLIGLAIPRIAKDWHVARGAFAPAVAAGLFGMCVGSACLGWFADRFGRRRALIGSVLLFGIATCLVSLAPNIFTIGLLRFFAGFGIGGAIPCSTTMTAELTPWRSRTLAVTATIVCVPLGGMVAGLAATAILPTHGWRTLFLVGGLLPIALSLGLLAALPESPRFLARHSARWPELTRLLARMGRPTAAETSYCDAAEQIVEPQKGFGALFSAEYLRDTLALWCAFFMCLLTVYSAFSWLPTMLVSAGLSGTIASSGLTAYNLGGVFGALLCAAAIARFGSRWAMLACCAGAALSALALRTIPLAHHTGLVLTGLGIHGFFVNAVQSTLYALIAYVYPTEIRARGSASAPAVGRLGAVLSGFLGAWVIAAGGPSGFLLMLAVAMLLVFAAIASVRRHIPWAGSDETEQEAAPVSG